MDKLEPILKQKFWILLGVGLIMTITGWWMASGTLAATIAERRKKLDDLEKVIPSGEVPNNNWTQQLATINTAQEQLVDNARREMWERQKAVMFWPPTVDDFAKDVPYQGEFSLVARTLYRDHYADDVEKVWQMCKPFNPLDGSGIVVFPLQKFPQQRTGDLQPTSKQMWEWQEDLWLLVPIMEAIRDVNGGPQAQRLDASIHVIEKLYLVGGNRAALTSEGGGGGGAMGGMDGAMSSYTGGEDGGAMNLGALGGGNLGGLEGGLGGGRGGPPSGKVDFDPKEEYGDGGGGPGGGGGIGNLYGGSTGDDGGADLGALGGGGAATSTAQTVRRYVDDDPNLPYKTRAFYLSVIMDHRKIPDLLAELTADGESPWPIEIGRVQVARLNPDDGQSPGGIGGAGSLATFGGSGAEYADGSGAGLSPMPTVGGAGSTPDYIPPEDGETAGALRGGIGPQGRSPAGAFETILADPNLARVAICGLIYIYGEVKPPEQPASAEPPGAPASDAVAADPGATGVDPSADSSATVADPSAPTNPVASPTDANPPAATEPAGNAPAAPASNPAAETPDASTPSSTSPAPAEAPATSPENSSPTTPN
jgi:hypothetical protein